MKRSRKPHFTEHALYYEQYINLLKEDESVLKQLKDNHKQLLSILKSLEPHQWDYAYAEGKWTIKQLLQHIIDVERLFIYRAWRFSRADKTPLSYYDENQFIEDALIQKVSPKKLLKEYQTLRLHTLAFFSNLNAEALKRKGIAGNTPTSANACAWIIAGHEYHHTQILLERYLNKTL
jgi:uncharacterized damage-inducible protein DinB